MIQIGINENVYLEKVTLDEKFALEFTFKEVKEGAAPPPKSLFANIAGDEVTENTDMGIRLFPPLPPKKEDMTEAKKVELVGMDINRTKGILRHLLLGYLTSEDLKGLWKHAFDGLPIDENNFNQQILNKEILLGVHKNLSRVFLEKVGPFLNKPELTFRLLLVRQSKEKHYATFRGKFIDDNPFWESMQIPKDASKVKFTDYEKREGLDNGAPATKSENADAKPPAGTTGAAPLTAANVFGGG